MEVEFRNVNKRYGDFTAVHDLSLKIQSGALHFLLGPSGCGKTTTLRMLAGLETVSSGSLLFDGEDVTKKPAADRGIGMVFQNYALWPHMTVLKNIEYGLSLRGLTKQEIKSRVDDVLSITQLTNFVDRLPGQLSGGQQQRVALARALAIRPSVLLLDEPLSNLDAKLRSEMRDNILRIHKQTGITTVYVTHDQKEALSMGTCISVMHGGHLIQTAAPREMYRRPSTPFIAGFIGETNLISGTVVEANSDYIVAETGLGKLKCAQRIKDFKKGEEVALSIRPEAVAINWDGTSNQDNRLELKVEHLTYLGESEQFALQGGDNVKLKANFYHAPEHDYRDGDKISCCLPPSDILVLPPQVEMGPGT